jgi:hypothetical protein
LIAQLAEPLSGARSVADFESGRRRDVALDRTRRILGERALNDAYVAERNKPSPF